MVVRAGRPGVSSRRKLRGQCRPDVDAGPVDGVPPSQEGARTGREGGLGNVWSWETFSSALELVDE